MSSTRFRPRRGGFTLVEMIVVVAIMAVLVALLMPSLGKAVRSARKLEDLNRLRQIGIAWSLYARTHDDHVLPGFLGAATQRAWNVRYRYPDGEVMTPAPDYVPSTEPADNMAGPWSWRLMPYLDYDFDVMLGYRGEDGGTLDTKVRALEIRQEPAFAYNGLYVGGWVYGAGIAGDGGGYLFDRARDIDDGRLLSVVSRTQSSIRRPSSLLTFTSAAQRYPGVHKYNAVKDDYDAIFNVLPPIVGRYRVWGLPDNPAYGALDVIQMGEIPWFNDFEEAG
ncbi:MAG: type II secretion system protein [Planctomycetota bacterium]|jgi:prepilin-type N-terminal cleavage/methylation domain-containing protein